MGPSRRNSHGIRIIPWDLAVGTRTELARSREGVYPEFRILRKTRYGRTVMFEKPMVLKARIQTNSAKYDMAVP